jgi:hypothetical protein
LGALLGGRAGGHPLELEQHRGHRLPDLIVQAAGEPLPLLLLRLQGICAGVAALRFQPLEHRVEGPFERADLARADHRDALPAAQHVGGLHPSGQPLKRLEQPPEEKTVDDQHDQEPDQQAAQIDQSPVLMQRAGRESQNERSRSQDCGVRREHAPEQRHLGTLGHHQRPA